MTFLLDVNVLIAILDPLHVHHDLTHDWFEREGNKSWATCPLTENALVRVVSQPSYPNAVPTPSSAIDILRDFCSLPGHTFWPDSISILDETLINSDGLLSHGRVTDTYLLALAASRNGSLATLDRRLVTSAVTDGQDRIRFLLLP